MQFILGISLTLNAFFIIACIVIYKFRNNDLFVIKNEMTDRKIGINKDSIVDYSAAKNFLKWGVSMNFFSMKRKAHRLVNVLFYFGAFALGFYLGGGTLEKITNLFNYFTS